MRYCLRCQTGQGMQLLERCSLCGEVLVIKPVKKCVCGNLPRLNDAYCRVCGRVLEIEVLNKENQFV